MENRIWFTYLFPIHIDETLIFSDTGDVRFAYVLSMSSAYLISSCQMAEETLEKVFHIQSICS